MPEISRAQVREDAPFDKICYIGCGVTTGIGAVAFTMKVEPGSTVAVFGLVRIPRHRDRPFRLNVTACSGRS